MRTQVAIVGAGPAGLMLAHLLGREGIESVVVEQKSQAYIEQRVRAGVLEHGTVELLTSAGLGDRLLREGLPHHGFELRFEGESHRIDLTGLTGRSITVYGQQEVVKDLVAARQAARAPLHFEVTEVGVHGIETDRPVVTGTHDGGPIRIEADYIAGCDGFHGICRAALPATERRQFEREYPFGWVGILAEAPPSSPELIYARHERGFALHSMRSATVTRLYVQCGPNDRVEQWPDQRIWDELHVRLGAPGWSLTEGPIFEKSITGMRSFVVEPMQSGRLFLAGDAAHIVPPTGAKGLNLALADVAVLARGLVEWYRSGSRKQLDEYSATCLGRVWRAEDFSAQMTGLLHRYPNDDTGFDGRLQLARLRSIVGSRAGQTALAEGYVG